MSGEESGGLQLTDSFSTEFSSDLTLDEHDDAPFKRKLTDHRPALQNLEHFNEILDHLKTKGCLSAPEYQDIMNRSPQFKQVRQLVKMLYESETSFIEFVNALWYTQSTPDLFNLLSDVPHNEVTVIPLCGEAFTYHQALRERHQQLLKKVTQAKRGPLARKERVARHDLESYIKLTLYPRTDLLREMRTGFREMSLDLIRSLGHPIEAQNLFKRRERNLDDPKSVMVLGAPGVGKTATMYFFLQEYIENNLWIHDFDFIFFVLFRDINRFKDEVTFQELLFHSCGPKPKNPERIWNILENNQERVLFILDGYDECNGLGVNIQEHYMQDFLATDHKAPVQTLLYNLITGNIMKKARVLVTTRPHCGDSLKEFADRTVELGGIDWDKLQEMIHKSLAGMPKVIDGLISYLRQHDNIVNLCYSPVNAKGFLNHVKHTHRGFTENSVREEDLPSTRADLMLVLVCNCLREHDRTLTNPNVTRKELLDLKKDLIQKLGSLAYAGLITGDSAQQLFSEDDLEAHDLNEDEVTSCGLMSSHISTIADEYWDVIKMFASFEHMTYEEFFAALRLIDASPEHMAKILRENSGSKDVIVHMLLGMHGDKKCHWALSALHPNRSSEYLSRQAQRILKIVWTSPRQFFTNGILFCITTLLESCQFQMSESLRNIIANPFGCLNLSQTIITPSDCNAIAQFFSHISCEPFEDALIEGRPDVKGMQKVIEAGGTKGLALNVDFTSEMLAAISNALNKAPKLRHLLLMGQMERSITHEDWEHFEPEANDTLKHIGFWGLLDSHTLAAICSRLHNLRSLEALVLYGNKFSHTIPESPLVHLTELTNIRYLILQSCSINLTDIQVVCKLIVDNQLLYLDITDNKEIGDEGASLLALSMRNPIVRLQGIIFDRCNLTARGVDSFCHALEENKTLHILDMARNNVGDGYKALVKLLQVNSTLQELDLADCRISSDGVYCLLDSLKQNKSLFRLCVVKNEMDTLDMSKQTIDILSNSQFLRVLDLSKCNLNDELLEKIYLTIKDNHTLSVFDVSQNPHLTETFIIKIIEETTLEHLNIAVCQLGPRGWRRVAEAMQNNQYLISVMAGDPDAEEDTIGFLEELKNYEILGPLEHIFLRGDRRKLAESSCRLERSLSGRIGLVSFVKNVWAFYMMSGMYWNCLDKDIRMWISFAGLEV